jgi:hypothetical protein
MWVLSSLCIACKWVTAFPGNTLCLQSSSHFGPDGGALYSSEALVFTYKSTRYHTPEDHSLNSQRRETLKIYIKCSDYGIWCSPVLMNIMYVLWDRTQCILVRDNFSGEPTASIIRAQDFTSLPEDWNSILFVNLVRWEWVYLTLRPLFGLLYQTQTMMMMIVEQSFECELAGVT